jgi:SIR2-like domain
LSDEQTTPKIMFFLGAGASVPADVKGVVELVSDYKDWLSSNNKSEDRKIVEEIEETLQKWLARQNIDRQVDIELVLEAIERLENANNDVLLDFLDNKKFKLSKFKEDRSLSKGLKQCIREKCFIPEHKTRYLKPLLDFLNLYNTLSIFSTNYDNSIEQFCSSQDVRCEVGFDTVGWNPELFKELKKGIKLYKIHGSITSWKTEEEDYNNLPLKDLSEMIELSSGRAAIPAIVFPGKKLEYSEPVFDTLVELKRQLRVAGNVFIVGYSFKDEHITRLFQYAAKKNRKLIVILVNLVHMIFTTR